MEKYRKRVYKSLKLNALLNTIKTLSGIIFPLITFPYISRVLSVDSVGAYNFSSSIISYFTLLAGLGISTYAIREGSQYREDSKAIEDFASEVFTINIISTIVSYILLLITITYVPKLHSYSTIVIILSIEIICATLGINWLCNIFEDFLYVTVRTVSFQLLSLIATFLFVRTPDDIMNYVIIVVVASSGANLLNYYYIRKHYVSVHLRLNKNSIRHIKPIMLIFFTTITITIYVNSDMTILGFLADDLQVGLYSASVKIYTIIKNVLISIVIVLVPRFSVLINQQELDTANTLLSKTLNTITIMVFPVTVGLFMISHDVIQLIAGDKYIDSSSSLRILSVATMFSLFAYVFTNCILLPQKKELIIFYASLFSAIVNIVLNLILIPYWGINAAAFTTVIAEMIICAISIVYSRSFIILDSIRQNALCAASGCIGIIVVCICSSYITVFIPRLIVELLFSIVIYIVILDCLNNPIFMEFKTMIKSRCNTIRKRLS